MNAFKPCASAKKAPASSFRWHQVNECTEFLLCQAGKGLADPVPTVADKKDAEDSNVILDLV